LQKAFVGVSNPPAKLWWKGKEGWNEELFKRAVTVVGSRRMTEYGRRAVDKMVPNLVEQGMTIISGMMYGVDQAAHRMCLECGGKTVAVLGWGINYQGVTKEDMEFMSEIIQRGGLVISEWENQAGTLWTFPMRDRIMAALAKEVYVVEAAVKSGSMITVEWARRLGKPVWAVPGPVTSKVSEGTNKLIADGLARMWLPQHQLSINIAERYTNDAEVYSLLEREALTVDEMARKLHRPVEELGAKLSLMVLAGEVKEREGKYYLIS
jgi:DNA processing protein